MATLTSRLQGEEGCVRSAECTAEGKGEHGIHILDSNTRDSLPVVIIIDSFVEGSKLWCVLSHLTERDNVHSHVVLLQLAPQLCQLRFVRFDGATYKHNQTLALRLVLPML